MKEVLGDNAPSPVMLVLVLVLKDSLRTNMQSVSLSLLLKSLSLSWSLNKSVLGHVLATVFSFKLKVTYSY